MKLNESDNKTWEELAKFLAHEMESSEEAEFEQKVNTSEFNRNFVKQVKSDWIKMEKYNDKEVFDSSKAWEKLHGKLEMDGLLENSQNRANAFNLKPLIRIAAIFIFGVLLTTVVFYLILDRNIQNWQMTDTYKNNEIKEITLSDGSKVTLNANSKLYFPEQFSEKERVVEFEGDAFFDIAKNPDKPFVIKAKDAEIKVLGTSFNVNTNLKDNAIEVLVETGKVSFSSIEKNSNSVVLEPGYLGKLNKQKVSVQKNSDKNYLAWKTKYFDFTDGIKLGDAINILNRAYNSNLVCRDKAVCNKVIRTSFNNHSLEKIIEIICSSQSLKLVQDEDDMVLISE